MQVIWCYIGTGNLKWHIETWPMRDTQMLIYENQGSMSVSGSKFCPKRFRKLLVASIMKHDLPFRFVEYDGRYKRNDKKKKKKKIA